MNTTELPAAVAAYLSSNRDELFEFTETLLSHDTQNPPGRTVEFGFGTQTAHGTDGYTTTEALVRNAISYGTLPVLYEQLTSADE